MTPHELIERGFHIFPIRPNTKLPYKGSWYDKTVNTAEGVDALLLEYPGCAWAVNTGYSKLTVGDIDNKNGGTGSASWQELVEKYGGYQDTMVVETPSGGYHVYFYGDTACSASKVAPSVDVRSSGGYVVAPGSSLPNGEYKVVVDKPIAQAPQWFIDIAGQRRDRTAEAVVGEEMTDEQRKELVSALETMEFTDYDSLIHRGMEIHSAYPGPDGLEVWTDWCAEVYPDHDPHVCEYKWGTFTHGEGSRTLASLFHDARETGWTGKVAAQVDWNASPYEAYVAPIPTTTVPGEKEDIEGFSDWATLREADIPAREWVLGKRYLKKFLTGIISPGGLGKSTFTLIDAISICIGTDLLTGEYVKQGNAWIHNAEDPLEETQARAVAICKYFQIPLTSIQGNLFITSGREITLCFANKIGMAADVNWLHVQRAQDYIRRNSIIIAFFDPLVRVHNVEENNNEQFDKVFRALTYIAETEQCSIVPVHHTRKLNGADGAGDMDSGRGGSSMSAACRSMFTLSRMDDALADKFGIERERKGWYVRLADAKANLAPPLDRQVWFERISVPLDNGDQYGSLKHAELTQVEKEDPKKEENEMIYRLVAENFCDGKVRALADIAKAVTEHGEWCFDTTPKTIYNRLGSLTGDVFPSDSVRISIVRGSEIVPGRGSVGVRCDSI